MELLKFEDFHEWRHPNAEEFLHTLAVDLEVELKTQTAAFLDEKIYVTGVYGGENAQICEHMTEAETKFWPYMMFHPRLVAIRKELRTIDKAYFEEANKCFGAQHCLKMANDKTISKMDALRKESMPLFRQIKERTLQDVDDYMKACVKDQEYST